MIIRNEAAVSHDIDPIFAVSLIFLFPRVLPRNLCLTNFVFPFTSGGDLPRLGHGGPEGE
jgi:hypothetical protein